ncbi:hypothetical protein F5Y04DRAFT_242833 [Hypomontagnella monticulosa]|nr:hypothetical protein F5Y04DRAFT_242833 [Hypomontagnella monticulosa]
MHPQNPHSCGIKDCGPIKDRRSLLRHINTSIAHSGPQFHCCCGYATGRKDKFRGHFEKNRCVSERPYECSCGRTYSSGSTQPDDREAFSHHFNSCGKRKPGRPPGQSTKRLKGA